MKKLFLMTVLMLSLMSCETNRQLYSWSNYVNASYQNEKKQTPESLEKLMAEYDKLIIKQKGARKTVPPGIYAEKGYQLFLVGQKEAGLENFRMEKELYPESSVFIDKIIIILEQ